MSARCHRNGSISESLSFVVCVQVVASPPHHLTIVFFFSPPFFLTVTDPHDDNKIGIDGIQQFCDDLGLDPASISVLLIAWKFRAATQCEFSKQEFMDGMTEQG